MTTIHDVATRAGVSTATVSRVLNGKRTVDPALVARVRAAADALGYHPSALGRSLRRRTTAIWTLIIADIENPFFTAVARGVEDVAQREGYSVVLCNSDDDLAKERQYCTIAISERVAGVLICPITAGTDTGPLAEHDIPTVAIDRPLRAAAGHLAPDTVLVGTRDGARQAVAHLMTQGYERIACITGPRAVATAHDRLAGYRDALRAAGRPTPASLVRHADFRLSGGFAAAGSLLDLPDGHRPDAMIVGNALMAAGALVAMRERGLHVGADIGFVTFDDAPWTLLVDPPLSTVTQPAREVGRRAAELLADRIANPTRAAKAITLPTELVVRGSSTRPS